MPFVHKNFAQIGASGKGYVTQEDIAAFARTRAARRAATQAPPEGALTN